VLSPRSPSGASTHASADWITSSATSARSGDHCAMCSSAAQLGSTTPLRHGSVSRVIAAATGLLIVSADSHVNNYIQSPSFVQDAVRGSNVGLGIELGAAGLAYLVGCTGHRSPYMANSGFTALEAMGAASVVDLGIKEATNRQYAYAKNTHGEFWEGGGSFPSGHAAAEVAYVFGATLEAPVAFLPLGTMALLAHLSLVKAGKHYISDTLVGGMLGLAVVALTARVWPPQPALDFDVTSVAPRSGLVASS